MKTLNLNQSELYFHVMHWIEAKDESEHSFIEVGAIAGKTTCLGHV